MPSQINSQIFKYLNQFASKAKGLTTAGMIILFVTSVMTMMTVESAFNVIWRVRKARPLAQRVLVYWAIITLGPILFGCSLSISSYLFAQSVAFAGSHHLLPPIVEWALTGVSLPLTVLAFTMLYVYMPNCKVEWRDAVIGGLIAAVAFELGKRGFGYYVRRIPTYTAVYGAFAALPVFLLWVYLCWMIALIGAMVTSALPAIRIGQFHRRDFPGSDLLDSLELLARLVEARDEGKPGQTALELARMLRCDMDTSMRLLSQLEAQGWIGRLEDVQAAALRADRESEPDHGGDAVRPVRDRSRRAGLSVAARCLAGGPCGADGRAGEREARCHARLADRGARCSALTDARMRDATRVADAASDRVKRMNRVSHVAGKAKSCRRRCP